MHPRLLLVAAVLAALPSRASAQVNPDGSLVYEVPIETIPTASGIAPKISLAYSSHGGDGPLGIGWRLVGLPAIVRINAGDGVRYDAEDSFAGMGGELHNVDLNAWHSENEDWTRYETSGNCASGSCSWYGFMPDGTVAEFGTSGNAAVWSGTAGIRSWGISKFSDSRNRGYTVAYLDAGGGQRYPQTITWDAPPATSVGGLRVPAALVMTFTWEDRPDPIVTYDQGTRVVTSKRLQSIRVARGTASIREYRLEYAASPTTSRSRLQRVRELGSDLTSQARVWTFTWANGYDYQGGVVHTQSTPLQATDDYKWQVDITGDGRTDLVAMNRGSCSVRTGVAQSNNVFVYPSATSATCTFEPQGYLWPGDFNGDGKTDIAFRRADMVDSKPALSPNVKVFLSNGTGGFTFHEWGTTGTASTSWGPADETFVGDFDGDGKTDIATKPGGSANGMLVRRSTGSGFSSSYWTGYGVSLGTTGNRYTGDFDGDGKTDIACPMLSSGINRIQLLRSNGSSFDVALYNVGGAWNFNQYADDTFLGDFQGDGRLDIMSRASSSASTIYLHSFTGRAWETRAVGGQPIVGEVKGTGDFNGDGRTDFVECSYSSTAGTLVLSQGETFRRVYDPQRCRTQTTGYSYLGWVGDFDGDGTSDNIAVNLGTSRFHRTDASRDLITSVHEGHPGSSIPVFGIVYTTAVKAGSAVLASINTCRGGTGSACGRANASPRPLVTELRRRDGRGGEYRTKYEYYNGRVLAGKPDIAANLGFEWVRTQDLQTLQYTDTWYMQARPFQGQVERSRTFLPGTDPVDSNPILIAQVVNSGFTQWQCDEDGCVTNNATYPAWPRMIRASQTSTYTYELGNYLSEQRRTMYYDAYGSPSRILEETWKGTQRLSVHNTERAYINRAQAPRVIGLINYKREYAASTGELTNTEYHYYDNQPHGWVGQNMDPTEVARRTGTSTAPWEWTRRTFDEYGNMIAETDPRGQTNAYEYSSGRFLSAIIEPSTGRTNVAWDTRSGQIARTESPTGLVMARSFDVFLRVTEETWSELATNTIMRRARYSRDAYGSFEQGCRDTGPNLADAQCTSTWTDALGREYLRHTPAGATTTLYDTAGRLWKVSQPYAPSATPSVFTTREYDAQSRIARSYAPDGALTQTVYNAGPIAATAVARTTVIDPANQSRTTQVDGQGRPVIVEEPGGLVTSYSYDTRGRLVQITKPGGAMLTMTYDDQGNRIAISEPNTGTTTFEYHRTPGQPSYGQLARENRPAPNGPTGAIVSSELAYDALGRIAMRATTNGEVSTWSYDAFGRIATTAHDTNEHTVKYELQYDVLGREIWRRQMISGALSDGTPLDWSVQFKTDLDATDRPTQIHYPDGLTAAYVYPMSSGPGLLQATLGTASVVASDFDIQKRPQTITFGNGVEQRHAFDPASGRVSDTKLVAGTTLASLSYTYDPRGLVSNIHDHVHANRSLTFSYDALRRLTYAARGDGKNFSYQFDLAANLVGKSAFDAGGNVVFSTRNIVPGTNRLADDGAGAALVYSEGGQRVKRGDLEYVYDDAAQLTEVRKAGRTIERHLFDAERRRVASIEYKSDGYLITYDAAGVHQERRRFIANQLARRQTTSALYVGSTRMAAVVSGDSSLEPGTQTPAGTPGARYFHGDHLGSTSLVTNEAAEVITDMVYAPYGEIDPILSVRGGELFLFTGVERQDASGMQLFGWRAYDSELGVFLQPDSLAADPFSSTDYNPYLYVRGNPVQYTDPTGHFPMIAIAIGIGVVAGAIIGASEGKVLSDPGKWLDLQTLWKEGSWKGALAGAAIGGLAGAGFWYLGGIGGSVFGTPLGSVLHSAGLGAALEMATAYGMGKRSAKELAGAAAIGAFSGVMARTGFFGAARIALRGHPLKALFWYGLAQATESLVSSSIRRSFYDEDIPLEVCVFFYVHSTYRDKPSSWRVSFGMLFRQLVGTAMAYHGYSGAMAYDFSPLHRDRIYQGLKYAWKNHPLIPYAIAIAIEGTMILNQYPMLDQPFPLTLAEYGIGNYVFQYLAIFPFHIAHIFPNSMFDEHYDCDERWEDCPAY